MTIPVNRPAVRARDVGLGAAWGPTGPANAITDVAGVRVGHTTLTADAGPVRTGVTVVLPRPHRVFDHPVFAGCHRLNGNGELTGLEWVRESGLLTTPVALTNTHSVGVVRDALVAHEAAQRGPDEEFWTLPVVGEIWDGRLNDINGQHVRAEHVHAALAAARGGPVAEGNVGGGTGAICHGFKGGIGTASRIVADEHGTYTLGVLVQANHGARSRFTVDGCPVGALLGPDRIPLPGKGATTGRRHAEGSGSIIGVVATDAPLLPHQCGRLAQRAALGIARLGAVGEHYSGDLFLAFATGNDALPGDHATDPAPLAAVRMLPDARISPLFTAAVDATEEAVLNALLAARTLAGRGGVIAHALPAELLRRVLSEDGWLRHGS
ncbi:P1 family peptidase [Planosporangium thailandense]|uniref:P1 family peptidase n=1 Tax=Planosporangium thailandense TaxID=765197 RepID=A0ABX0Y1X5_9ACTN|nr:P1 family peptidase [Planosporangium thailandense]NJC72048.1 P1 family peptidase [Planosporangium thailandense]